VYSHAPALTSSIIYLDNNATTQPSPAVIEAVTQALSTHWPNPSSVHRAGQAARQQVELARQALADLIGVKAREITLTSSGTESIDLAIRGSLNALSTSPRKALITTKTEHAAVRDLAEELEKSGRPVRWIPVSREGLVDVDALAKALTPDAALVSIQWANNETGVIQPVAEIANLCRERGTTFHCDAVQMIGKEPVAAPLPCDLLSFSPHKFHGPKGVGVLWARPNVKLRPTLLGTQELGRRAGTENVPGILGAGVAAEEAAAWLNDPAPRQALAQLRDRFEELILKELPDAVINGKNAPRLWNTTNIGFPRLEAEALLLLLSERGLCASAGAACSSGSLDPSPVLLAMGIPEPIAHGSLRFSLSKHTTREEIDQAAAMLIECVGRLRQSMTP
jgi:cysteine desulfurase